MNFLDLLDQEIAAQERVLEVHPAYVKLRALRATRALYVENERRGPVAYPAAASTHLPRGVARRNPPPMGGKSLDAVNAVVEILASQGRPMRTAELMPHILDRGIKFKGNAPQNILSSLLSRSDDVVSKGGHVGWALALWDSEGGDTPDALAPPPEEQPQSRPVEPGQEVAHDNIA